MKKLTSFLVFCLCLAVLGSLLSSIANAQQSKSTKKNKNNQKKPVENPQQADNNQQQTTPPVRPPEQIAILERLIDQARTIGLAPAIVGVRDFATQDELLRQLAPFRVESVVKYQYIPYIAMFVDAPALIYMKDSSLVTGFYDDNPTRRPTVTNRTNNPATTNSPNRPPDQLAVLQRLLEQARATGKVMAIIGTRDFEARNELMRQLTPLQPSNVTLYQNIPFLFAEINEATIIFLRDSPLVTSIGENLAARAASNQTVTRSSEQLDIFQRLNQQATANDTVRVIVGVRANFTPEGYLTPAQRQSQRAAIQFAQDRLLSLLAQFQISNVVRYQTVPYVALNVDTAALAFLRNSTEVTSVGENLAARPALAESVPLIGAPNAWSRGFSGVGETIAVLDSGVDKYHPFLRNKVVSEACYSTTTARNSAICPGGVNRSTQPDSGVNCNRENPALAGCYHGTHVAGIATGRLDDPNPNLSRYGVARDGQLIAVQIFSRINGTNDIEAQFVDINLGLDQIVNLTQRYKIAAVNLSIEFGTYEMSCDNLTNFVATRDLINQLRSYGVATIAAAGNYYAANALSYPACISSAVSVGSTQDGSSGTTIDRVSNFSNRSPLLSLFAPGEVI